MGPPPLPISGGREIRGSQPDSPPHLHHLSEQDFSSTAPPMARSLPHCAILFLALTEQEPMHSSRRLTLFQPNLFMLHKFKHFFKNPYYNVVGSYMAAETSSGNKIISLALSANDGTLIALTDTFQLMMFNMKEVLSNVTAAGGKAAVSQGPVNASSTKNEFSVFSYPFHCGSVTGVDVCQRKPLVVTCGTDRSIRVWNYLSMELELSKEFEENVESVALHPTGKDKKLRSISLTWFK